MRSVPKRSSVGLLHELGFHQFQADPTLLVSGTDLHRHESKRVLQDSFLLACRLRKELGCRFTEKNADEQLSLDCQVSLKLHLP